MPYREGEKKIFAERQLENAATLLGGELIYSTTLDSYGRTHRKATIVWEEK